MPVSYHIYSNNGIGGPIDYSTPVATASGTTWTGPALSPGAVASYAVRAFDTISGLEESNTDATVTIMLDASGNDVTAVPMAPAGLSASPRAGGVVRVSWSYPSTGRVRRPAGFRVYAGTPAVAYSAPAAVIPYDGPGSLHHFADLSGLTPGTTYAVAVRAYNASGEEANTATAFVTPDASGPSPVDSLVAS